jgi:hypothetical protein
MRNRRGPALAFAAAVCLLVGCSGDADRRPAEPRGGMSAERESPDEMAAAGFIGGASEVGFGGYFTEPSDVAVYAGAADEPDDDKLFVVEADRGRNARVQRLDRHGNFELAWGRDVVRSGAPGDTGPGAEICRRARSCQRGRPGAGAGALRMPTAVAVDATGHLFVMDSGNRRVQQFSADGRFVRAWGWGVATGSPRFEVCVSRCREGRYGRPEGDANPGQFGTTVNGGIAVGPGRGDLFATDGGNRRVMQFARDGRFLRAWGFGIQSGASRLETCGASCKPARTNDERWFAPGGWPRHVAVDGDGVVYATDDPQRSRLVRFDSTRHGASPDASDALLPPLPSGHRISGDANMGIEIDPATRTLVTMWDQGGPAVIDVVTRPGAADVGAARRRSTVLGTYVGSVNGVGVSAATGAVYLPKSADLNRVDPGLSFRSCPTPGGGSNACQGLMVLAAAKRPRAAIDRAAVRADGEATVVGTVAPGGTVSYRFQIARDGRPWADLHPPRYLTSLADESVRAEATGLEPGVRYAVRLLVTRRIEGPPNLERVTSDPWPIAGRGGSTRR